MKTLFQLNRAIAALEARVAVLERELATPTFAEPLSVDILPTALVKDRLTISHKDFDKGDTHNEQ